MSEREAPEVESTAEIGCTAKVGTATFDELMRRYENQLLRQALLKSQGRVTRAAQLLGISHQRLIILIERRHRDLLSIRSPVRARKRSIINEK